MRKPRTLTDVLLAAGDARPEEIAFCLLRDGVPREAVTRAELLDRGLRIAAGLRSLGAGAGDRIVMVGDPSPAWVSVFAGAILAGAVPLPIHPRSTSRELEGVVTLSGATHAVLDPSVLAERGGAPRLGACRAVAWDEGDDGESVQDMLSLDPAAPVLRAASDSAVVLQTSGTTGAPKCVIQTHGSHADFIARWTALTMKPDDRVVSFLPLNHQGGLLLSWLSALAMGCPTYQLARFSVGSFWAAVREHECTWTILMQPVPRYLLEAPPGPDDSGHSLRFVDGSARPHDAEEIRRRFGIRLVHPYGSTETTVVAMSLDHDRASLEGLPPDDVARCAGPPLPDWQLRIVDDSGQECPASTTGALEVHGPGLFPGYLNDEAATAKAFTADGWFRTGDRAYVNRHDELFFVERAGNAIRRSGENISAAEVEAFLEEHPDVAAACVVGVPDELRGQEVRACIALVPGSAVTAEELFTFCLSGLAKFKVPRYIDFWPALPRTATFKVSRSELASDPRTWVDRYASAASAR